MKAFLFIMAGLMLPLHVGAQVSTATQTISRNTVSSTAVSSQRLSGSRGGSASSPYDRSYPITTVYGEAQGKTVIAPEVKNTTVIQAHYIRPDLGNGGKAFSESSTQDVRLPLATQSRVYWVPNQQSLVED